MKKIIPCIIFVFLSATAFAETWCMWDGTQGVYCQSDTAGYIKMPSDYPDKTIANNVIKPADFNAMGYYLLVTTQPTLGENQVRDQVVWGFADNQITKTWTVRDLTTEEIDQQVASPMPLSEYYLWKALIVTGVITQQQAVANLPQELIDAYLARDRLENPE